MINLKETTMIAIVFCLKLLLLGMWNLMNNHGRTIPQVYFIGLKKF